MVRGWKDKPQHPNWRPEIDRVTSSQSPDTETSSHDPDFLDPSYIATTVQE
jgi:hypothetical protein